MALLPPNYRLCWSRVVRGSSSPRCPSRTGQGALLQEPMLLRVPVFLLPYPVALMSLSCASLTRFMVHRSAHQQHYQANDQMDWKARPSTAPQYALGGGGGDMAAFSRRFFSAESMARRPKSPPRCPSSQMRHRPASKVRRYNSARTSKEGHPGYEVSSRVSQDLKTLNRKPRSSATAMETALSYMSRGGRFISQPPVFVSTTVALDCIGSRRCSSFC